MHPRKCLSGLLHVERSVTSASTSAVDMQDAEVAKGLAFSQEVRTRCITLQGDDFNPSGTLTGRAPELPSIMLVQWS